MGALRVPLGKRHRLAGPEGEEDAPLHPLHRLPPLGPAMGRAHLSGLEQAEEAGDRRPRRVTIPERRLGGERLDGRLELAHAVAWAHGLVPRSPVSRSTRRSASSDAWERGARGERTPGPTRPIRWRAVFTGTGLVSMKLTRMRGRSS